jgi:predicted glutamine amidotransferase
MCGIVGMFSLRGTGTTNTEAEVLRDLAVVNTVRGWDGTGIVVMEGGEDGELLYQKEPVPASSMCNKDGWDSLNEGVRFSIIHNRAATIGKVDEAHTHPFLFENVIGVHNGTVGSWKHLFPKSKQTMDSAAIFEALNGADATDDDIVDVLTDLDGGAYTLVWYDIRSRELKFARNMDRPLKFSLTTSGVWFASEQGMLDWALERHKYYPDNRFSLAPYTLLSIPVEGGEGRSKTYTSTWNCRSADYSGDHSSWRHPGTYSSRAGSTGLINDFSTNHEHTYSDGLYLDCRQLGALPDDPRYWSCRTEMYAKAKELIGVSLCHTVDPPFPTLACAITAKLYETEPVDHVVDTLDCSYLPVHIVDVSNPLDKMALGYVDNGDRLLPVHLKVWGDDMLEHIKNILLGGHEAVVQMEVRGVRFWASGVISYDMGELWSKTALDTVQPGDPLDSDGVVTTTELYGEYNPYMSVIDDAAPNWVEGWK